MSYKVNQGRSAARFWAVQALYQMEIAQCSLQDTLNEFQKHRVDKVMDDGIELPKTDFNYFANILRGVIENQKEIDQLISDTLREDWKFERLDSILRSVLRAGVFEIKHIEDVPMQVTVSQYTDMSSAYFDNAEAGMVNAILDKMSKKYEK